MTSSTLIHLCNYKSDSWESAVISFSPSVLHTCSAVCRSAPNRFRYQTNSTPQPHMADVFWGRRRSCLEMRCSSRRTKRRQGPQAWSCEVRWEEDDIIVSGQKLQRGGRGGVTRHSLDRSLRFLYVRLHVTSSTSRSVTHPNMSDCRYFKVK